MDRGWIVSLLLICAWEFTYGQSVSIRATDPDYSHKTIRVTAARNPFITVPEYTSRVVCGEGGEFEYELDLDRPGVVQLETGIYQAYLYLEPGYHYDIQLPPYREKTQEELISPFFQPVVVSIFVLSRYSITGQHAMEGPGDINEAMARFDSVFTAANQEVIRNRKLQKNSDPDALITGMEAMFSSDTSSFFAYHRKYKYGLLKLNEGKTGLEGISREFLGPVVQEWHPGFMELFRAMFRDFLFYYERTPEGKGLGTLINRGQPLDSVRQIILRHPAVWNDTLADMILLQELSFVFYRGDYHKEAIIMLLDSISGDPAAPRIGLYASQVKRKLSSLLAGHPPPDFTLPDLEGNLYSLADLTGKYLYLFFGTPNHYGCMMEYPFLQSFQEKHAAYLRVVTVMVSDNREELKSFMERNKYTWKVLKYIDPATLLDDYMVKSYPTAYLLAPDGTLLLSPAVLPSHGFEQQFFRILRSRGEI